MEAAAYRRGVDSHEGGDDDDASASGGPQQRKRRRGEDQVQDQSGVLAGVHHGGSHHMYMRAKCAKLNAVHEALGGAEGGGSGASVIFSGCCIHVNGDTVPAKDDIQRLMQRHGGQFEHLWPSGRISHVIVSSLPDQKLAQLRQGLHARMKWVVPAWIVDSVAAGRRLSEGRYLLLRRVDARAQPSIADRFLPRHGGDRADNKSGDGGGKKVGDTSPGPRTSGNDPDFIRTYFAQSRLHHIGEWRTRCPALLAHANNGGATSSPGDGGGAGGGAGAGGDGCGGGGGGKVIIHIDMDCFFASVALLRRPTLRSRPVAVAHGRGGVPRPPSAPLCPCWHDDCPKEHRRPGGVGNGYDASSSEVSSANYPARRCGVRAGMFLARAFELCPSLTVLPYDFAAIDAKTDRLYRVLFGIEGGSVHPVSCDEAFVDVTALVDADMRSQKGHPRAEERKQRSASLSCDCDASDDGVVRVREAAAHTVASRIRAAIVEATGCPCSAGLGPNRLVARVATRAAKPDGQHVALARTAVQSLIAPLPLSSLPGVGRKRLRALVARFFPNRQRLSSSSSSSSRTTTKVPTCAELLQAAGTRAALAACVGEAVGTQLWNNCCGRDARPLATFAQQMARRRTIGAEVNYGIRFLAHGGDRVSPNAFVRKLAAEVAVRLQTGGGFPATGRRVALKLLVRRAGAPREPRKHLGHGLVDRHNLSAALAGPTADAGVLGDAAVALLSRLTRARRLAPNDLRGIGIVVTDLTNSTSVGAGAAASVGAGAGRLSSWLASSKGNEAEGGAAVSRGGGHSQQRGESVLEVAEAAGYPMAPYTVDSLSQVNDNILAALPPDLLAGIPPHRHRNFFKAADGGHKPRQQPRRVPGGKGPQKPSPPERDQAPLKLTHTPPPAGVRGRMGAPLARAARVPAVFSPASSRRGPVMPAAVPPRGLLACASFPEVRPALIRWMRATAAAAAAGEGGIVAGPTREMLTAFLLEAVLAGRLSDVAVAARYIERVTHEDPVLRRAGWGPAAQESVKEATTAVRSMHGGLLCLGPG